MSLHSIADRKERAHETPQFRSQPRAGGRGRPGARRPRGRRRAGAVPRPPGRGRVTITPLDAAVRVGARGGHGARQPIWAGSRLDIPHVVDRSRQHRRRDLHVHGGQRRHADRRRSPGRPCRIGTPGFLVIVETATITGGTGRFAGATGSFVVERLYDIVGGTTIGSFDGTISRREPVVETRSVEEGPSPRSAFSTVSSPSLQAPKSINEAHPRTAFRRRLAFFRKTGRIYPNNAHRRALAFCPAAIPRPTSHVAADDEYQNEYKGGTEIVYRPGLLGQFAQCNPATASLPDSFWVKRMVFSSLE